MKRSTILSVALFLVAVFAMVPAAAAESTSEKQRGNIVITPQAVGGYTGSTSPLYMYTYFPDVWSTVVYFDLTDMTFIPSSAVVTGVRINYTSSGRFFRPAIAVFDENGQDFYVHDITRRTDGHNGKPARQRWSLAFWVSAVYEGPVKIWPTVSVDYEY